MVDKESPEADFDKFLEDLPPNECRMGVFDFQYNIGEGLRSKVLFVLWYVPNHLQDLVLEDWPAHGIISGLLTMLPSSAR